MEKGYKNRQMKPETEAQVAAEEIEFFFPKHVPPVVINAKTREEAEEKLAALDVK